MENLYQGEKSKKLDSRGIFIIQGSSNNPIYIFWGANVPLANKKPYLEYALHYVKYL